MSTIRFRRLSGRAAVVAVVVLVAGLFFSGDLARFSGVVSSREPGAQEAASASVPAYVAPVADDADAWTLALVPDTQTYVSHKRNCGILELATAWLAENKDAMKIGLVCQVGDLVNRNDFDETNNVGNLTSAGQWTAVSRAFERLDGQIPYVVVAGNHDYGVGNTTSNTRNTKLNDYFPVDRIAPAGALVETFPNANGDKTIENALYAFDAPDGKKYFVLALECLPRDVVLDWALEVARRPEYRDAIGIVVTHIYMRGHEKNNEIIKNVKYANQKDGNAGVAIWEKLLYPAENLRIVLCGHISAKDSFPASIGFAKTANAAGKSVAQFMFDVQAVGGGFSGEGNGGDGWIQFLKFGKDGKTIRVQTFSPLFAISPTTQKLAWNRDPIAEFEVDLDAAPVEKAVENPAPEAKNSIIRKE